MKTLFSSEPQMFQDVGGDLISVRTCSNNIPTIFLENSDGLTTELASGTSDNDGFLGRSHILLVDLNCFG